MAYTPLASLTRSSRSSSAASASAGAAAAGSPPSAGRSDSSHARYEDVGRSAGRPVRQRQGRAPREGKRARAAAACATRRAFGGDALARPAWYRTDTRAGSGGAGSTHSPAAGRRRAPAAAAAAAAAGRRATSHPTHRAAVARVVWSHARTRSRAPRAPQRDPRRAQRLECTRTWPVRGHGPGRCAQRGGGLRRSLAGRVGERLTLLFELHLVAHQLHVPAHLAHPALELKDLLRKRLVPLGALGVQLHERLCKRVAALLQHPKPLYQRA